jgi:hypothetical protein
MNMKPNFATSLALTASLLSIAAFFDPQPVAAQTTSVPSTATRPAKAPEGQTSLPNNSPPATATQTTGQVSPDPSVRKMNDDEKKKVETEGK